MFSIACTPIIHKHWSVKIPGFRYPATVRRDITVTPRVLAGSTEVAMTDDDSTDHDSTDQPLAQTIPIGRQRMTGAGELITAYRRMKFPVLISERVWIERKADDLVVHVGRPTAQEVAERPA
jgi:hypothetical protein